MTANVNNISMAVSRYNLSRAPSSLYQYSRLDSLVAWIEDEYVLREETARVMLSKQAIQFFAVWAIRTFGFQDRKTTLDSFSISSRDAISCFQSGERLSLCQGNSACGERDEQGAFATHRVLKIKTT